MSVQLNLSTCSKVGLQGRENFVRSVQVHPCNNKEILLKREGEIIREIGTLNKEISGRTREEYEKDNTEKLRLQNKLYYKDNADKIGLRQKIQERDGRVQVRYGASEAVHSC